MPEPEMLGQAYELLCAQGEQFPGRRDITLLNDVTFNHPKKGQVDISIDEGVVAAQGKIYIGDRAVRTALEDRRISTDDLDAARAIIETHLQGEELVWGFSGYATAGFSYKTEAQGLHGIYNHLNESGRKPSLAIDGGVSAGSLGLNGVVARMHEVTTMGVIPLQGLSSVGVRDHLVVWGNTYKDREVLVGTIPDVLVCIGGGEGAQRECQTALRWGSTILLLALNKEYGPNALPSTYKMFPEMATAVNNGTMVVCRSLEEIPESTDSVLATSHRSDRIGRISLLDQLLCK